MNWKFLWAVCVFIQLRVSAGDPDAPLARQEVDEELSSFIREVLENFRDQMPEGIPEIGVPPLDPLRISDVDRDIEESVASVALRMRNISVTGISGFRVDELVADLQRGFANFSLQLPELQAQGHCHMDGKVLRIFPVRGDGPFYIDVRQVTISGHGDLNMTSADHEVRLHMDDLRLDLDFGPLEVRFESLLGGAQWTQVLVKLLTGMARPIFQQFRGKIMVKLNQALLALVNKELDKGTLNDILDQIPLGSVRVIM